MLCVNQPPGLSDQWSGPMAAGPDSHFSPSKCRAVQTWLASLPTMDHDGDTSSVTTHSELTPSESDYDDFQIWVPGSTFAEHAHLLGGGGGGGGFEKQGAVSVITNTNSAELSQPSIAVPRVKSSQRQIYQNWRVMAPVKAPAGVAVRPLLPPTVAMDTGVHQPAVIPQPDPHLAHTRGAAPDTQPGDVTSCPRRHGNEQWERWSIGRRSVGGM